MSIWFCVGAHLSLGGNILNGSDSFISSFCYGNVKVGQSVEISKLIQLLKTGTTDFDPIFVLETKPKPMESIDFINKYPEYLQTIKRVSKEKYHPVIEIMEGWDPHDLVSPESWFPDENSSLGFVYRLFIKEVRKVESVKQD